MQGMRRWMGEKPSPNLHEPRKKTGSKAETKNPRDDAEPSERNSTEYIAKQLMNPEVPQEERDQYKE